MFALSCGCESATGGRADADASRDAGVPSDRVQLAYSRRIGHQYDIVLTDIVGRSERVLSSTSSDETFPAFSSDGRRLAFSRQRSGRAVIEVVDLASGASISIGRDDLALVEPAFSPDGRSLVFQGIGALERHLYVATTTGGALRQLTYGATREGSPAWAMDGRTIYFVAEHEGAFELFRVSPMGCDGSRRGPRCSADPRSIPPGLTLPTRPTPARWPPSCFASSRRGGEDAHAGGRQRACVHAGWASRRVRDDPLRRPRDHASRARDGRATAASHREHRGRRLADGGPIALTAAARRWVGLGQVLARRP